MSLPRYESYKDSGVEWLGEVPSHWEFKPLFALVEELNDSNAGMKEDNLLSLSYGRIKQKNIDDNDGLLPASFETYQIIQCGDIVWRLTDLQNDQRSLRTAIAKERGIITSAYLATRPLNINPDFLAYLLRAYDVKKVFYSMGGGLRQSMKFADVKRLPAMVPSASEQRAIVAFLDRETAKIDALIDAQERLITLLNEKRQAVISHAVTKGLDPSAPMKDSGVEWLGKVPAHWEVRPARHMLVERDERSLTGLETLLTVSHLTGVTRRSEKSVNMFEAETTEGYKRCHPGDLVINTLWAWMGAMGVASEVGIVSPAYHVYVPRPKYAPSYIGALVRIPAFARETERFSKGVWSSRLRLYPAELFQILLPLPPLDEQVAIAKSLERYNVEYDALTGVAERAITLLKERRAAVIAAAVTGKIDVRTAVQAASDKELA